ncbi:hypothetical protein [Bifidobacterium choloepi]|uniref:DNA polymerase III subunit epsilon n=1 Tax=Bifidobacterium choloepi TaxID=2614131 RepID=A0A6I5MZ89_9BIFI|nr:hypothetical protein [Bifidobacterium choloepi]NEG69135.1 hypothetical protein [Bifidobacterium choloepi]
MGQTAIDYALPTAGSPGRTIAIAIETTGDDPFTNTIRRLGVVNGAARTIVGSLAMPTTEDLGTLRSAVEHAGEIIVFDAAFVLPFLGRVGIAVPRDRVRDVMTEYVDANSSVEYADLSAIARDHHLTFNPADALQCAAAALILHLMHAGDVVMPDGCTMRIDDMIVDGNPASGKVIGTIPGSPETIVEVPRESWADRHSFMLTLLGWLGIWRLWQGGR